jgi:predicted PurR-regulated permease PerM
MLDDASRSVPAPNPEIQPSQVTLKTVFTVSFGLLLVIAVVEAVLNSVVALSLIAAAVMIAVALDHLVRMLEKRGVGRSLAIAIVTVGGLAIVTALGFTLIPPAIDQGRELIVNAPKFARTALSSTLFRTLDSRFHFARHLTEIERRLPEVLEGAATPILNAVGGLLTAVAAAVTITFLVVFMLIFGGRLVRAAISDARPERKPIYEDMLTKIYQSIGGYLGGLSLICTINAVLTTSFLAIDMVPFFLPLGIASGLSSMVPYAGPFVTGTAISIIALFTKGTWHGLAAAIYFVVYGQLEGNIIGPLVFRRTVHVNPLVVTLSILILGEIGGIVGAIVAVPVVAVLQIILREVRQIRRQALAVARDQ